MTDDTRTQLDNFIDQVVWRARVARHIECIGKGLLAGSALALVWLLLLWLFGAERGTATAIAYLIPLLSAGVAVFRNEDHVSVYEAVKLADQRLGFNDQLAATVDFLERGIEGPMVDLVVQQTAAKLDEPTLVFAASPLQLNRSYLHFVIVGLVTYATFQGLFPPPVTDKLSAATRRELQDKESLEGLLELEADIEDEAQKKEFERFKKLIDDLNLMSENATKEEILARLSREISDLGAEEGKDDAMSKALDELKKYRDRVALGDLMDEVQQELDKGAEELAVVDESGRKVSAEAIQTLALVEKKQLVDKAAKKGELAKELKDVARAQQEKADAGAERWGIKKDETEEGERKTLKGGPLSYETLSNAVEDRDIRAMILSAAGDKSRSTDAYQEVYQNYNRILESVLFEQRVPSGQQLYVRRYFKVIKPKAED